MTTIIPVIKATKITIESAPIPRPQLYGSYTCPELLPKEKASITIPINDDRQIADVFLTPIIADDLFGFNWYVKSFSVGSIVVDVENRKSVSRKIVFNYLVRFDKVDDISCD